MICKQRSETRLDPAEENSEGTGGVPVTKPASFVGTSRRPKGMIPVNRGVEVVNLLLLLNTTELVASSRN